MVMLAVTRFIPVSEYDFQLDVSSDATLIEVDNPAVSQCWECRGVG